MELNSGFSLLSTSLQVFLIDLLLSGDNAVVIALACRGLPRPQMRQAVLYGTAAAILLRLCFTTVLTVLLDVTYLKLVGAAALMVIAVKLLVSEDKQYADPQDPGREGLDLWSAVGVVVVADVIMSLDNVVALAAVARGSVFYLALGLLASVPLLMYGSLFVTGLIKRYPILIPAGGALLGWIAGDIASSDPAISDWLKSEAPALGTAMPFMGAAYVLLQSRIVKKEGRKLLPGPVGGIVAAKGLALAGRIRKGLAREPSEGAPPQATLVPATRPGPETSAAIPPVLVAVNDPTERDWLRQTLGCLNYPMETADNGGQALELLRSREYGLLIIDPLLPGIDGLELAVRPGEGENSIGRHLRAIVLSEPDQDYSAQQLFDAGFQDNLPRPLTDEGLRAVLAYWLPTAAPEEQPPGQSRDQDPFPQPPPTNGLPGHLVRRWEFLRERKKYWLLPMIFVVVVFLIMILMSGNSTNYPIMRK